jgi:hypothetical protein
MRPRVQHTPERLPKAYRLRDRKTEQNFLKQAVTIMALENLILTRHAM